jgi:uncharacterized membrane protein YccC
MLGWLFSKGGLAGLGILCFIGYLVLKDVILLIISFIILVVFAILYDRSQSQSEGEKTVSLEEMY